jgi:hypothetical protein
VYLVEGQSLKRLKQMSLILEQEQEVESIRVAGRRIGLASNSTRRLKNCPIHVEYAISTNAWSSS